MAAATHRLGEAGVLLQELHHTVGQLGVVADQRLDLVQRDEHSQKELFVLLLQRQSKPVDDTGKGGGRRKEGGRKGCETN